MDPLTIVGCVAMIAAGVALIAYILLRTPKNAAPVGTKSEISLGEPLPSEEEATDTPQEASADGETAETAE